MSPIIVNSASGEKGKTVSHELKCWPEFFEAIKTGRKTHDLRRADDRVFTVGDVLLLREFDPTKMRYTGRQQEVEVTYITREDSPCPLSTEALHPAFCILSISALGRG